MRAIILAAGRGKRMGYLTKTHPKALLQLHGKPLIEWQISALRIAGITEIAIITGYRADVFFHPVTYFNNPQWEKTNMLSTLYCGEEWLNLDTCVISYSDIVYHSTAVKPLLESEGDIVITFDPNWLHLWKQRFQDPLSDAEIFKYSNDTLIDIGGSTNVLNDIQGQYMGLLKFTADGWKKAKKFLEQLSIEEIGKLDMTAFLKLMVKNNCKITVVPVESPWCEIDSISDYQLCHRLIS